ncbi:MAG: hypothetical protein ACFCU6_04325 [Balneolaceae bacterium]
MIFKKLFTSVFLFIWLPFYCSGQTLKGYLLSANNEPIPSAHIQISPFANVEKFLSQTILAKQDGKFTVIVPKPGLYNISVKGAMHHSVTFPMLFPNEEARSFKIYLEPLVYRDGKYFDNEEYLYWIRVYGNFNNYSYQKGIPFEYQGDGTISAPIFSRLDTVRYVIRGLTTGPGVLPGADRYDLHPDGYYEALIHNPDGVILLEYNPDSGLPYQSKRKSISNYQSYRAHLVFKNESDLVWVKAPQLVRSPDSRVNIATTELFSPTKKSYRHNSLQNFYERLISDIIGMLNITEDKIDAAWDNNRKAVWLLAYAGLFTQLMQQKERLIRFGMLTDENNEISFEKNEVYRMINDYSVYKGYINQLTKTVTPVHPVWSLNRAMVPVSMDLIELDTENLEYFKQIAMYHPDEFVSAPVFLKLLEYEIKLSDFKAPDELTTYSMILERFGDRNLARKARDRIAEHLKND